MIILYWEKGNQGKEQTKLEDKEVWLEAQKLRGVYKP